jgi:acyl-CoA reductase-like NAD-dependent aldehyde dehydrogenase
MTLRHEAPMLIGGKQHRSARWAEQINPANLSETVGRFADGDTADADAAVAAALEALAAWRRTPVTERAEMLVAAGAALQARSAEWADLLTREHGKIRFESMTDFQIAGSILDYYGSRPELLDPRVVVDPSGELRVALAPHGVCAGIIPWNWPIVLSATKIGPALLAGNTLVLKAPDHSALAMLLGLAEVAEFFPPGVLNLVSGRGPVVGRALVNNPTVRKIAVTGGTATGRAVMAAAAERLTPLTLELGGNDAAILLRDAPIDDDVAANLMLGAFSTSGQICFAIKRLFVHESRHDELVDALSAVLDTTVVGDGLEPETTMGPVNNERQFTLVRELTSRTEAAGLEVRTLGSYGAGVDPANGYFLLPRLVLGATDVDEVVACEQFGPILPILSYRDETEAIARANALDVGLCSSLWTADEERAFELAEELDAGTTFINGHSLFTLDLDAPFGGVKSSGLGRELGPEAVLEYTQFHTITNKRM